MNREIYYKYFEEQIKPNILHYETERKNIVFKTLISSSIMFVLGIICAYIFILLSLKNSTTLLFLPIILFLMYVFFIKSITNIILKGKEYQNSLAKNILPLFLKPVANFKDWPKNRDIAAFLNSGLFPNFEAREDEISFFGIYKNVNIILCSTKLTVPPNHKVFQGVTIQLELPKSIDNHVVFISKEQYKFNPYTQINPHIEDLNTYLYTFSKNENTSFITENFWNCIKNIGEAYTAKGFGLSYDNNTILISLDTKKPFKFGFLFKSLLKPQNYDELIDMFVSVFNFVDVLL